MPSWKKNWKRQISRKNHDGIHGNLISPSVAEFWKSGIPSQFISEIERNLLLLDLDLEPMSSYKNSNTHEHPNNNFITQKTILLTTTTTTTTTTTLTMILTTFQQQFTRTSKQQTRW